MNEFFKKIEGCRHHEDRNETRSPFLKNAGLSPYLGVSGLL